MAPNPRQNIKINITALADFMGEHSCKYSDVNRRPWGYFLNRLLALITAAVGADAR
jgi:hypothetical protein